ncbi:hypothetical protein DACRYDRAFT_96503 [Dacryopinax primogenitus]|uniref:Uncharacterized protein n=1 Tax=Dacryopinax primogenitus (strain DJM 731) TaxID=1858805 RepID=M5FTQ4_DACPD|nr:uncharacterized protein DACRYDRAFT_96503 [Dacryopinax primogenitus]EJT98809.1 hypothetical protein DACRYDRAFT_96503 [Dacryopinax primogenitus]
MERLHEYTPPSSGSTYPPGAMCKKCAEAETGQHSYPGVNRDPKLCGICQQPYPPDYTCHLGHVLHNECAWGELLRGGTPCPGCAEADLAIPQHQHIKRGLAFKCARGSQCAFPTLASTCGYPHASDAAAAAAAADAFSPKSDPVRQLPGPKSKPPSLFLHQGSRVTLRLPPLPSMRAAWASLTQIKGAPYGSLGLASKCARPATSWHG